MKFTDYEASYITPQKTLLKKLDEILKFLRLLNPEIITKVYMHQLTDENGHTIEVFNNKGTSMIKSYTTGYDIYKDVFNPNYMFYARKGASFIYYGSPSQDYLTLYYISGTTMSYVEFGKNIVSDVIIEL